MYRPPEQLFLLIIAEERRAYTGMFLLRPEDFFLFSLGSPSVFPNRPTSPPLRQHRGVEVAAAHATVTNFTFWKMEILRPPPPTPPPPFLFNNGRDVFEMCVAGFTPA